MSLSGKLDETPLPEVLRRLAAERCSGTLRLARGALRARIGLRHGRPVSVRAPGLKRLGDLLVAAGLADPITVQAAARIQAEERGRRPLGQILVGNAVLAAESLERMVRQQLEQALADLGNWTSGSFDFAAEEPAPADDLNLDLAATSSTPATEGGRPESTQPTPERPGSTTGQEARPAPEPMVRFLTRFGDLPLTVEILSPDPAFAERLATRLAAGPGTSLVAPPAAEPPASVEPWRVLLVVDLRRSSAPATELPQLRRRYPGVPLLAVQEPVGNSAAAYAAGAAAVVPPDLEAVAAAAANWIAVATEAARADLPAAAQPQGQPGREFGDLSADSTSATVALDLMQAFSATVERAVLFLVRRNFLVAAGAFGVREDDRPLAELTRGLRLDLERAPALQSSLEEGRAQAFGFDSGELPALLTHLVGRPRCGEAAVVPVSGGDTMVAVVYADNGAMEQGIDDLLGLEMAAARFGPPLETELLIGEAARTLG
jgi:hypothetical protein